MDPVKLGQVGENRLENLAAGVPLGHRLIGETNAVKHDVFDQFDEVLGHHVIAAVNERPGASRRGQRQARGLQPKSSNLDWRVRRTNSTECLTNTSLTWTCWTASMARTRSSIVAHGSEAFDDGILPHDNISDAASNSLAETVRAVKHIGSFGIGAVTSVAQSRSSLREQAIVRGANNDTRRCTAPRCHRAARSHWRSETA